MVTSLLGAGPIGNRPQLDNLPHNYGWGVLPGSGALPSSTNTNILDG